MSDLHVDALDAEDAKLATLARGAAGRVQQPTGAAVRDGIGRTYASAAVDLPSLRLTALQAAVAQAYAAGADKLEAAVLFGTASDEDGLQAAREISADLTVWSVIRKEVTRLA
ncbi:MULTISPECIES: cytidine deaminase [Glycomyces]|jgi:nucleotide-binding universal stress UspA family protein|uniref:Cytidine deaminase n=2 Tax=Glycomyces TaxID=58113 RepID=A0A9X3PKJ3_9ACTN|nr:cytidine deaminase [Glycomyces lechevalierae]MDA1384622.1 cytidine deaminase [Glycomyces lechevalierae]MDR7337925.1 nucleotide-binding universal stress UspA family protein [Glycomyces lechevalierae]